MIVIGSGEIETQQMSTAALLPTSSVIVSPQSSSSNSSTANIGVTNGTANTVNAAESGASHGLVPSFVLSITTLLAAIPYLAFIGH